MEPWSDYGEEVEDLNVPTTVTDGMSTYTRVIECVPAYAGEDKVMVKMSVGNRLHRPHDH